MTSVAAESRRSGRIAEQVIPSGAVQAAATLGAVEGPRGMARTRRTRYHGVSPLRFAPVEMTGGTTGRYSKSCSGAV